MTFFGYNIQMSSNPISSNSRKNQTNWLSKYGQKMKYLSYILFIISIPLVIVTFSFEVLIFSLPAFIAVVMYKSKDYTSFGLRTIPSLKLILIYFVLTLLLININDLVKVLAQNSFFHTQRKLLSHQIDNNMDILNYIIRN